jgi:hypothetical protein
MALSRDKQIGVALVVLAALGAAVYFQQQKDAKVGVASKSGSDLPALNGPEDLDKISITNGDKGVFVLAKEGDKWMLQKPVHALANQNAVKQLIDNLKELKTTELVAATSTDDLKKSYDLDAAHAVRVVAWKGADQKVDDSFGKLGSRGEMAMIGDKPAIYATKGFSVSLYNREQKGWRDTEIFKFDGDTVNSVTIEDAKGSFSFTKGDKWAGTFKGAAIQHFDEAKIPSLVMAFKSLQAEDFGDGKPASDTGLDKPEGTVTLTLKDNAGKYTLHVGKSATPTSFYAQKDGDPTIYTVSKAVEEWATADEAKFVKSPDAGAATSTLKRPPGMGGPHGMMPPGHPRLPGH